ncbi:hypothetical protein DQM68_19590 (plasmid) [Leptospira mayottensis]|uniref:Uncharacterized protein n=1 Tax=Leptospira mayottensis 200901116 TaxID=1192864 RepID=A0A343US05_9LEPT|nr:hypothetical protein [Leptospira mayottensis]AVH81578.1 hypothetical protein [Leptospira mayottensis 200901116]AXR62868.1 hypothetical protein DQM68_19590 [Leptospira mayottensis]TGN00355.1 hypothetical protein EHR03_13070 [Leptospira mayottensis]
MSDVNTKLSEQYYVKHILHTFKSEKSVLIEIEYYYPIGPQVSFRVSSWCYSQTLVTGVFYRDGSGCGTKYSAITLLTSIERRELSYKIYEEVDRVLELPNQD